MAIAHQKNCGCWSCVDELREEANRVEKAYREAQGTIGDLDRRIWRLRKLLNEVMHDGYTPSLERRIRTELRETNG